MSRKNFGAKPLTYPQPVFIIATYDENGNADAMNAAWGGISEGDELSLCLSAGHKTVKNLLKTGAFTVSMADAKHVAECDYVGIVSANTVPDKLSKAGLQQLRVRMSMHQLSMNLQYVLNVRSKAMMRIYADL